MCWIWPQDGDTQQSQFPFASLQQCHQRITRTSVHFMWWIIHVCCLLIKSFKKIFITSVSPLCYWYLVRVKSLSPVPTIRHSVWIILRHLFMHVCFPFRLNANTANTHHQALGECRAKGSGELKVEAKQQSSFDALHREKQSSYPYSVRCWFYYINGANKCLHLAEDQRSGFRKASLSLRSMSHSLQDTNSLSWQPLLTLDSEERSSLHLPGGD